MNRRGRRRAGRIAGLLLLVSAFPSLADEWVTRENELTVDGRDRTFLVFATTALPGTPVPAMIVMHGGLGNAEGVERLYGMNDVAAREGFIAVYPNGPRIGNIMLRQRRTWNAGDCCGPAAEENVDDVAFIRAMIDVLIADYAVDPGRVYASGMSNGAMMTYRLVCELPEAIAAAIPVAGTLVLDECAGGQDVPILHIHGASDENVPVDGGFGSRSIVDIDYRPLSETFDLLAGMRGCGAPAGRIDEFGAEETIYRCERGAPIIVRILPGVGHTWPGARARPLQRDRYDGEFSASEAAWAFARNYSKND